MQLPLARGPVSGLLVDALTGPAGPLGVADVSPLLADRADRADRGAGPDVLADEDLQLALTICYELHYRGFDGVDERWEWDLSVLGLRAGLEREFEAGLGDLADKRLADAGLNAGPVGGSAAEVPEPVDAALRRLIAADDGPSLSTYLRRRGTLAQFREFLVHRSIYQLKEADPHTWAIPRLAGRTKAALIEIQMDEYGGGRPDRMHATLFADTLRALGLDDTYGAHLDVVPASTLTTTNLMSLLGLHRRWRGALLGHLAVFEMNSAVPSRRYGDGLRRLGFGRSATEFYDEHVAADAVHEQVAAVDLCGSYVAGEPDPARARHDVLFGAACCLVVETAFAEAILGDWGRGAPSLRPAPGQPAPGGCAAEGERVA